MLNRRLALACLTAALSISAHAQDWPNRPIKLVVPFAPGSATDTLGREVAHRLSQKLGQPIVVDAKPGAGTSIGAQIVENSPPDGYTILMGSNATFAVNSVLYKKLPYDPVGGFKLVSTVGEMPSFLIVSAASKYTTLADFLKDAKSRPGKVTYASSGVGSTGHLVGEVLGHTAGVNLLHVPFKDGPQGVTAVISGEVDGIFYTSTAAMSLIQAGKLRPLAVSTSYRTSDLPKIPTVAESGYPNFDFTGWIVLALPSKTPPAIVEKLRTAMQSVQADSSFRAKLESIGIPAKALSPAELEAYVAKERARMVEVAKQADIKPE